MPRTKKLTDSQIAALTRLSQGKADFYDLIRVGATGATTTWLVGAGLATGEEVAGGKEWQITDAGRSALTAGRIVVS